MKKLEKQTLRSIIGGRCRRGHRSISVEMIAPVKPHGQAVEAQMAQKKDRMDFLLGKDWVEIHVEQHCIRG
ncbi:hypothetical protein SCG7086_AR_00010 [Chlamydiales bacterium SCGC AG-110-P3]|nr:hypothetical protein SCG7086_AR_00010 [Chlamydiales bacterium SCGC AG-110-P3]